MPEFNTHSLPAWIRGECGIDSPSTTIPPDCTWLKPLYDPAWDRVYAAIQDHDLVINQHSGQGSPDYGEGPVPEAL